jgi:hypothetical protein
MADDFLKGFNEILGQPAKFNPAVTAGFEQFKVMLEAAAKDATTMKIVTKAGEKAEYANSIAHGGDLSNDFPPTAPNENDIYWKRHNELVNV